MKINGKKLDAPNVELLVLPRTDSETGEQTFIAIKAKSVQDYKEFNALCPEPKPPMNILPGKGKVEDREAPSYRKETEAWAKKKTSWMILQSLSATENLEWEKINFENPDTWNLYEEEMQESGFGDIEVQRIIGLVMTANCLNEEKLKQARELFQLTKVEGQKD